MGKCYRIWEKKWKINERKWEKRERETMNIEITEGKREEASGEVIDAGC